MSLKQAGSRTEAEPRIGKNRFFFWWTRTEPEPFKFEIIEPEPNPNL